MEREGEKVAVEREGAERKRQRGGEGERLGEEREGGE